MLIPGWLMRANGACCLLGKLLLVIRVELLATHDADGAQRRVRLHTPWSASIGICAKRSALLVRYGDGGCDVSGVPLKPGGMIS